MQTTLICGQLVLIINDKFVLNLLNIKCKENVICQEFYKEYISCLKIFIMTSIWISYEQSLFVFQILSINLRSSAFGIHKHIYFIYESQLIFFNYAYPIVTKNSFLYNYVANKVY